MELDRATLARVRRNTEFGGTHQPLKGKLPDQTGIIKELVEMKAMQNGVKNKMRKVLFAADKGKQLCLSYAKMLIKQTAVSITGYSIYLKGATFCQEALPK